MPPRHLSILLCFLVLLPASSLQARAQTKQNQKKKKPPQPFSWVNKPKALPPGVKHATFTSPSMKLDVGYCIYLPTAYEQNPNTRFPVVYYLHGGRPGSETKSLQLSRFFHKHIKSGKVAPMIYVFVNGGPVSHYNIPNQKNAMGADVFVKELIPHIDATYRSIANRSGRGIEGFSQGGRATTRLMFRYPELFGSAAPGGAGHATEKKISENNGRENDKLVFQPGDNTYDLARAYATARDSGSAKSGKAPLPIMVHVGTKGFNYKNNLAYMAFLTELNIPHQKVVVENATHSAKQIYEKRGLQIMKFHETNFTDGRHAHTFDFERRFKSEDQLNQYLASRLVDAKGTGDARRMAHRWLRELCEAPRVSGNRSFAVLVRLLSMELRSNQDMERSFAASLLESLAKRGDVSSATKDLCFVIQHFRAAEIENVEFEHDYYSEEDVCRVLMRMGRAAAPAVPVLRDALESSSDGLVCAAAHALGEITGDYQQCLPAASRLLMRWDTSHAKVCDLAASMGSVAKPLTPRIVKLLSNTDDRDLIWAACDALGAIGLVDAAVVQALANTLHGKGGLASGHASTALRTLGKPAVPYLRAAMKKANSEQRKRIVEVIEAILAGV